MAEAEDMGDVPLQPVLTKFGVGVAKMHEDGQELVFIRFSTPSGNQGYFLDGASAMRLAGALGKSSRQVIARENVMNPKLIVPNGEV